MPLAPIATTNPNTLATQTGSNNTVVVLRSGVHLLTIAMSVFINAGVGAGIGILSNGTLPLLPQMTYTNSASDVVTLLSVAVPLTFTAGQTLSAINLAGTPIAVNGGGFSLTYLHT
jgi:hypothetical protein